MADHTRTLAYVSLILMEFFNVAMIGLGAYFLTNMDTFIAGIVLVVVFGIITLVLNIALCFYWSKL